MTFRRWRDAQLVLDLTIDPTVLTKNVLEFHAELSKANSVLLVQMENERIELKDFLFDHRVPSFDNAGRHYGEKRQTVGHVLLCCTNSDLRQDTATSEHVHASHQV